MPWLYTVLGALGALVLSIVPLAGLDTSLEYMPGVVDELQLGGLLAATWPWFIGGRAAARLTGWRRAFLAGTIVTSALATVGLGALLMEALQGRQALLLGLSGGAGVALLWWLADQLRERGALGGTMTVLAGLLLLDLPGFAISRGMSLATEPHLPLFVLDVVALLSPAVLGLLLWRRLPAKPPRWLPVKHPLELVLLPLAVAELAAGLRAGAPGLPYFLDSLAILGTVAGVIWLTRAETRGPPVLGITGGVLGLVVAGCVALGVHGTADLIDVRYGSGPLDGEHDVRVLCSAPGADLAEVERMRQRLAALHIEGDVQLLDGLVQLELLDVSEPAAVVDTLTTSGRFEIRAEAPEDPVLEIAQCPGCEVIPLGPPVLHNGHIELATMDFGYAGEPTVLLEFSDDGRATFGAMTSQAVGSRIALMVDGQVVSAPVVMEPILGGKAQLSIAGASVDDAQILATLLMLEPLEFTWTLRDLQQIDP